MTDAPVIRYRYKTQPYDHQKRALAKLLKLGGRGALFMPMRTGKTKVSIDWAGIGFHNFGVRRVLIVAPATVLGVWEEEIAAHCPVPYEVLVLDSRASVKARAQTLASHHSSHGVTDVLTFVVLNYDVVWREMKGIGPRGGSRTFVEVIKDWGPDLVIADEAHRLKNPTSKQSIAMTRIGRATKQHLALTGTPVSRSPLDAFGLFRFVDPVILSRPGTAEPFTWSTTNLGKEDEKPGFKQWYGRWGGWNGKELVGYAHLNDLLPRIRRHSFRVKLEDCFDLPERTFIDVPVRLSPEAMRIYKDMATEMIAELASGAVATAPIVLTKMLRLSQIASGFLKDDDTGEIHVFNHSKLDACTGLLEEMVASDDPENGLIEKGIVFCLFRQDVDAVVRRCRERGWNPIEFTGDTPTKDRPGLIRRFHEDPKTRVFVAQTATGSVGIDLTAARSAFFYSYDSNWLNYAQAVERNYGPKQKWPVAIHHLRAVRTIDRVRLNVLKVRGDMADAVIHHPELLMGADDEAS